jgi:SAM-dependent methyltransferase
MNTVINTLPFFFQSHTTSDNGGFPHTLPFYLYFDYDLKMFRQKNTPELSTILNEIYINGSLVEGSISSESGKVYTNEIVNYIIENTNLNINSKILEVGFGSGIILKKLKEKGYINLTGIEPGKHAQVSGLEGVELINDFFPTNQLKEKYELIYSLLVLEHIENPLVFLNHLIEYLQPNGKIIFGVPNCEPYLLEGDLSVFIHEHFSYFTKESIINLVNQTGLAIEDISIVEGAFIVTISNKKYNQNICFDILSPLDFNNKVDLHIANLNHLFQKYNPNEIAIYAPTRAINSLFITKNINVRLVDDNSELQNKYLPTLYSSVESYEQLVARPPKCLLIFSRTFGERIRKKCELDESLSNTQILTLNDLDNY